jgi:hypothetical protein
MRMIELYAKNWATQFGIRKVAGFMTRRPPECEEMVHKFKQKINILEV